MTEESRVPVAIDAEILTEKAVTVRFVGRRWPQGVASVECSKTENKLSVLLCRRDRGRKGEMQLTTDPGRRPTDAAEYAYPRRRCLS